MERKDLVARRDTATAGEGPAAHGLAVYVASATIGLGQALRTTASGAWGHEQAWLYIT
jgi:hypothetical protein